MRERETHTERDSKEDRETGIPQLGLPFMSHLLSASPDREHTGAPTYRQVVLGMQTAGLVMWAHLHYCCATVWLA